jgi:hypothetical protein
MTIAAIIVFLTISVAIHEYGHYRAMKKHGIAVTAAGLGLPLPPMLRVHRRGITWTLSPWLVGAYVEADQAAVKHAERTLPYRDIAWHWNVGIVINMAVGCTIGAVTAALSGRWVVAAVASVAAALTVVGRRVFAAYIAPALAVPVTAYLIYSLFQAFTDGVGVGTVSATAASVGDVSSPTRLLALFASINIGLALFNMALFYPLDNSRTIDYLIKRRLPRAVTGFRLTGVAAVLGLLVASLGSDLWAAATAAF